MLIGACKTGKTRECLETYQELYPPEEAYEEALEFLEAALGSEGPPADVLWKRLREGRQVACNDRRGLKALLE